MSTRWDTTRTSCSTSGVLEPGTSDSVDEFLSQPQVLPVTSSAYDTAVVAETCAEERPRAVDWLLGAQHPDGSWGAGVVETHDRLVCTLAAVSTLARLGAGVDAVCRGTAYLLSRATEFAALRHCDHERPVAFELIVPHLLNRCAELGLNVPHQELAWVEGLRSEKLGGVPAGALAGTSMVHALEALDDMPDLAQLRCSDGSWGCSPAASAWANKRLPSPSTVDYLRAASASTPDGGYPTIYRYELFGRAWVLNNLRLAGLRPHRLRDAVLELSAHARDGVLAMSAEGMVPDSDDTSVLMTLRAYCDLPVDLSRLDTFARPHGYVTYEFERNPSTTSNAHVLEALRANGDESWRTGLALELLRESQRPDGLWTDKWHLSPFYATSHAAIALAGLDDEMRRAAVEWFLRMQQDDGSWGWGRGTAEETAYAMLALMHAGERNRMVAAALSAGRVALEALSRYPLPELWIGKVLYAPELLVRSAILAAKIRYDGIRG